MTTGRPPATTPWWRRWWGITAIVFVVLIVLVAVTGGDDADEPAGAADLAEDQAPEDAPAAEEPDTPTEDGVDEPTGDGAADRPTEEPQQPEDAAPEEAPEPQPQQPATFEAVTIEGHGDDVIDVPAIDDRPLVASFTHTGASNFAVISYTPDGERVDLLVNEIGDYTGTVPYNFSEVVGELEITADGPWTVTLRDLADQPTLDRTAEGRGDEVLVLEGASGRLSATHDGTSNFALLAWGERRQLLVNEIGGYGGTVRMEPAIALEIVADGSWTLELE